MILHLLSLHTITLVFIPVFFWKTGFSPYLVITNHVLLVHTFLLAVENANFSWNLMGGGYKSHPTHNGPFVTI